jgi:hypothetical protein
MKVNPADSAFSKCVRERADWTCEKCGKKYEKNSAGLHCSHIFSRRHRTIRWCGDNAQALCFSCHSWFGGNPADSGVWVTDLLGEGHMALLREKKDCGLKIPKNEEKSIAKHYREQLKLLESDRINGKVGRIEFESYQ